MWGIQKYEYESSITLPNLVQIGGHTSTAEEKFDAVIM